MRRKIKAFNVSFGMHDEYLEKVVGPYWVNKGFENYSQFYRYVLKKVIGYEEFSKWFRAKIGEEVGQFEEDYMRKNFGDKFEKREEVIRDNPLKTAMEEVDGEMEESGRVEEADKAELGIPSGPVQPDEGRDEESGSGGQGEDFEGDEQPAEDDS